MPSGKTIKNQPFLSGKSPQNWLLPIPDLHRYPACATSFGLGWYSDGCFHLKNRLPKAINCHMYHHWNMLLNLLKPKSIVGSGWYGPPQHITFHHWVYKYLLVIPPKNLPNHSPIQRTKFFLVLPISSQDTRWKTWCNVHLYISFLVVQSSVLHSSFSQNTSCNWNVSLPCVKSPKTSTHSFY